MNPVNIPIPSMCTQVGEPVCSCCTAVDAMAAEIERLRGDVTALPEGHIAPRIAHLPVAEPYLMRSTESGPAQIIVTWPDNQPDVCLITRAVLLDMVEQLNRARRELAEWHYDDCAIATDPDAECTCWTPSSCDTCGDTRRCTYPSIGDQGLVVIPCPDCTSPTVGP